MDTPALIVQLARLFNAVLVVANTLGIKNLERSQCRSSLPAVRLLSLYAPFSPMPDRAHSNTGPFFEERIAVFTDLASPSPFLLLRLIKSSLATWYYSEKVTSR
jgi:hypothetical protein